MCQPFASCLHDCGRALRFNIMYHPRIKDFFVFIQENLLQYPEGKKKGAVYLSVKAAIECYMNNGSSSNSMKLPYCLKPLFPTLDLIDNLL